MQSPVSSPCFEFLRILVRNSNLHTYFDSLKYFQDISFQGKDIRLVNVLIMSINSFINEKGLEATEMSNTWHIKTQTEPLRPPRPFETDYFFNK